jgi:Fe2+ or Zn2+ uptake regulation protein
MIEDVAEDTSKISDSIASKGYTVRNVDLIVRGYCDKCVRSGKAI